VSSAPAHYNTALGVLAPQLELQPSGLRQAHDGDGRALPACQTCRHSFLLWGFITLQNPHLEHCYDRVELGTPVLILP
jgi:hypothetical protein